MKKLVFLIVILIPLFTFAQTDKGKDPVKQSPAITKPVNPDSLLLSKYETDLADLTKAATDLQNNIASAQKQLDEMIGQIKLRQYDVTELKKKMKPAVKQEDKKEKSQ